MKQLLIVLALGATLAGTIDLSGITRQPVDRNAVNVTDATETATPEATPTPLPDCEPPEFYDPWLNRCRLPDTPEPSETPAWSPEIQATMDANPYDNDWQYINWCFDYVDGGTRIIYYPCDATPEAP